MNSILQSSELAKLAQSQPFTQTYPAQGMMSYRVLNVTPYYFSLLGTNGHNISVIPPWTEEMGSFLEPEQQIRLSPQYQLPNVSLSSGMSSNQWGLYLGLYSIVLSPTQTPISNASGNPSVNIGTIASGATVDIGNTVTTNASITNEPTFNISSTGNSVKVTESVPISAAVTNSPNVNIASIASGATVDIGNTVTTNASITNEPTFNISSTGNSVEITNTVTTNTSITNEPTMNISSSGNQIEVAGQIQNSTLTVSQAYAMECDFTFSASSSQTINQTFAPQNQLTNVLRGKLYLYSPNGYSYNVYITPQANVTSNILSTIPQDNSITVTGSTSVSGAGTPGANTSNFYWQEPQQCNGFQIQLTTSSGGTVTENPILWLVFDGNATPLENSYLTAPAYSFLQADTSVGVSAAGSASGNHAFPVSIYSVNDAVSPISNTQISTTNPFPIAVMNTPTVQGINDTVNVAQAGVGSSTSNPLFVAQAQSGSGMSTAVSASTIGSNATVDLGFSPVHIYRLILWTNGPGVLRLLAGTAWLAHFENSVMVLDFLPGYYDNGGAALTLYNTDTTTQYYTFWMLHT